MTASPVRNQGGWPGGSGWPRGYSPRTNGILQFLRDHPGELHPIPVIAQAVYGKYDIWVHRRIAVLVSRHNRKNPQQSIVSSRGKKLGDPHCYGVPQLDPIPIQKTRKEVLFERLAQEPGKMVRLAVLAETLYGDSGTQNLQRVRSIVNRHRFLKKLPKIKTHKYRDLVFGYSLVEEKHDHAPGASGSGLEEGSDSPGSTGGQTPPRKIGGHPHRASRYSGAVAT